MRAQTQVLLASGTSAEALHDTLVDRVALLSDGSEAVERTILDTFDWRGWEAGGLLHHEVGPAGAWLTWSDRTTGDVLGRQAVSETPAVASDVPQGPVRRLLADVLDVRVLLPRARVDVARDAYRARNDDLKTVAYVAVERVS